MSNDDSMTESDDTHKAFKPVISALVFAVISICLSTFSLILVWLLTIYVYSHCWLPCNLAVYKLDRCIFLMERRRFADDILSKIMIDAKVEVSRSVKDNDSLVHTLK
ncbi:unnamed protein product [Bursaphelenchus okinawaensis]|uniref:Uncharacterized protein n=1 Tax=Bursaphelenchus okinawaensis TaxID=465554 RepID=A0A811L6R5_9BILA|nr:unnamed protein product [Bursaphelenchus okinawaensis]CAG9119292.1 unnamed protein product [Bursaphelenchus okinawaensis]